MKEVLQAIDTIKAYCNQYPDCENDGCPFSGEKCFFHSDTPDGWDVTKYKKLAVVEKYEDVWNKVVVTDDSKAYTIGKIISDVLETVGD